MTHRLGLLRHGHTAWNRAGRIQGRTDIPLEPDAEALLSGLRLPQGWETAELWSSPLARATQTAELVSGRVPLVSDALLEMDWGDWEGAQGASLQADAASGYRHIEDWGWDYRPPNGESPADLRARLVPWANALTQDAIAVCHIGVMRVLMAHATGWDFSGPAPFQIKRNRLFVIEIDAVTWRAWEETPRLVEAHP